MDTLRGVGSLAEPGVATRTGGESRSSSISLEDPIVTAREHHHKHTASHREARRAAPMRSEKSPLGIMKPLELHVLDMPREASPVDGCPLLSSCGSPAEPPSGALGPIEAYSSAVNSHDDRFMRLSGATVPSLPNHVLEEVPRGEPDGYMTPVSMASVPSPNSSPDTVPEGDNEEVTQAESIPSWVNSVLAPNRTGEEDATGAAVLDAVPQDFLDTSEDLPPVEALLARHCGSLAPISALPAASVPLTGRFAPLERQLDEAGFKPLERSLKRRYVEGTLV